MRCPIAPTMDNVITPEVLETAYAWLVKRRKAYASGETRLSPAARGRAILAAGCDATVFAPLPRSVLTSGTSPAARFLEQLGACLG